MAQHTSGPSSSPCMSWWIHSFSIQLLPSRCRNQTSQSGLEASGTILVWCPWQRRSCDETFHSWSSMTVLSCLKVLDSQSPHQLSLPYARATFQNWFSGRSCFLSSSWCSWGQSSWILPLSTQTDSIYPKTFDSFTFWSPVDHALLLSSLWNRCYCLCGRSCWCLRFLHRWVLLQAKLFDPI